MPTKPGGSAENIASREIRVAGVVEATGAPGTLGFPPYLLKNAVVLRERAWAVLDDEGGRVRWAHVCWREGELTRAHELEHPSAQTATASNRLSLSHFSSPRVRRETAPSCPVTRIATLTTLRAAPWGSAEVTMHSQPPCALPPGAAITVASACGTVDGASQNQYIIFHRWTPLPTGQPRGAGCWPGGAAPPSRARAAGARRPRRLARHHYCLIHAPRGMGWW